MDREYTFYFEICGSKKRWSTFARNERDATKEFHAMLLEQTNIIKVELGDFKPTEPGSYSGVWAAFDDVFKQFDGIFDNLKAKKT